MMERLVEIPFNSTYNSQEITIEYVKLSKKSSMDR